MASSHKGGWVYDHATATYVRWDDTRRCWVNQDGAAVRGPQAAQGITATGNTGSAGGSGVPGLTKAMGGMKSPSQAPTYAPLAKPSASDYPKVSYAAIPPVKPTMQSSGGKQAVSFAATPDPKPTTQGSGGLSYAATLSDPKSGVKTRWEVGATTQFQDPANSNSNRPISLKRIREVEGTPAKSSKSAIAQQNEYRTYRVIEVLLVPPEDVASNVSRITPTGSGNVRLRRFVIVREIPERSCIEALPIKTYNFRGVAAPGVIKSHHSMIYTGSKRPTPTPDEAPGRNPGVMVENGMQPHPIRVESFDRAKALDPMARLDYADRYEFEWGVSNMRIFGRVHEDSHATLFVQYNSVWTSIMSAVQGAMPTPSPSVQSGANTSSSLTINPGPGSTKGSSTIANYGSSRGPDTAGSSVSVPAVSAQALLQRYAASTSGQCTEQQVLAILQYLKEYARRENLPMPGSTMTPEAVTTLARDPKSRARYIQKIRDRWRENEEEEEEEEEEEDDDDDDDDDDERR